MKFLSELITPALALAAALVALSTPAYAQETPTDPSALPSAQPAGPTQEAIAAHEAVLRRVIGELQAGAPNYDQMVPALATAVRNAQGDIQTKLAGMGPIKTVTYATFREQALKFTVTFERGVTVWFIVIDAEGKIAGLVFRDETPVAPAS